MIKEILNIPTDTTKENIQMQFNRIAKSLFNEYEIIKGDKVFQFLEIEFYFYNKIHPDDTTYKRIIQVGKWHTHLSGVDISFESNIFSYGGILIRSMIDNTGNVTNGPLCTLFELFNNIDVEKESYNIPQIKKKEKISNVEIKTTTRFNINSGEYKDCDYRYYNAAKEIKWKSSYTANPMHKQSK